MNALVLALFLVLAPAAIGADAPVPQLEPTVDEVMKAYVEAGWFRLPPTPDGLVCIDPAGSDYVDRLVAWLAARARRVRDI